MVLSQIYETIPPLAIGLISHITLPDLVMEDTDNNHVHSDALFVQIETHNRECTICWEIIDDGVTTLNNVFNPHYEWKNKTENNEHLLQKLYIYIEPEL